MNFCDSLLTKRIYVDGGIKVTNTGTSFSVAAGSGDTLYSTYVDTMGFQGVRFLLALGTLTSTAGVSAAVYGSALATTSASAYTAITGAVSYTTTDNDVLILEAFHPSTRYVELVTSRVLHNSVVDSLLVELFDPIEKPSTAHSTVDETRVTGV